MVETKVMPATELELKTLLLQKKKDGTSGEQSSMDFAVQSGENEEL